MRLPELIKNMRWAETVDDFYPTCSSVLRLRGTALELIYWFQTMEANDSFKSLTLDTSKCFGQEAIAFISENDVLSTYLEVQAANVNLSSKLSETEWKEIIREVSALFPRGEPLWR